MIVAIVEIITIINCILSYDASLELFGSLIIFLGYLITNQTKVKKNMFIIMGKNKNNLLP